MKDMKNFLAFVVLLIGTFWFPATVKYEKIVYTEDMEAYNYEKQEFEQDEDSKEKSRVDSLIDVWASKNDTTIRTIQKITKEPIYDWYGYYKKTGNYICEKDYHELGKIKSKCVPEKVFVPTDSYVSGYKRDTTWTAGYKNRDEWKNKAYSWASETSKLCRSKFREYDGHEERYLSNNWAILIIGIITSLVCPFLLASLIVRWHSTKP